MNAIQPLIEKEYSYSTLGFILKIKITELSEDKKSVKFQVLEILNIEDVKDHGLKEGIEDMIREKTTGNNFTEISISTIKEL